MKMGFFSNFSSHFSIDLRALSFLRIATGSIIILLCLGRLSTSDLFLSSTGVLPVEGRAEMFKSSEQRLIADFFLFPFRILGDRHGVHYLVFTGILGITFSLGVFTKLLTPLLWYLMAALRFRQPYAGDGGDLIIVVLLFWMIFLPIGKVWAVSFRKRNNPKFFLRNGFSSQGMICFSPFTVMFLLQICVIYWIAAVTKYDSSWRLESSALLDALSIESLTRPLADNLILFPEILSFSTGATLVVEEVAPFAALAFPIFSRFRTIGPTVLILLHVGIALTMNLGLFPWICIAMLCSFLPVPFWNRVEQISITLWNDSSRSLHVPGTTLLPVPLQKRIPPLSNSFAAFLIGLLFLASLIQVNQQWFHWRFGNSLDRTIRFATSISMLQQDWSYFAPSVNTREGWISISIRSADDTSKIKFDWKGDEAEDERPNLRDLYANKRIRGHVLSLLHSGNRILIDAYADWVSKRIQGGVKSSEIIVTFVVSDRRSPETGDIHQVIFPHRSETKDKDLDGSEFPSFEQH